MGERSGELVRAQAMRSRGVDIGERRAQEIAADMDAIDETVNAVRELLDFNDEPACFIALLCAPPPRATRGK
jgi:hypothetical protein